MGTDSQKNALSAVAPHPDTPADFLKSTIIHEINVLKWLDDKHISAWLNRARLWDETNMGKYRHLLKEWAWVLKPINLQRLWGIRKAKAAAHANLKQITSN